MASWNEVIDALATWWKPDDIKATLRFVGSTQTINPIVMSLEIDGYPEVASEVTFERPATIKRTWERIDEAAGELRRAVEWHKSSGNGVAQ